MTASDNKLFTDFKQKVGKKYSRIILEKDASLTQRQVWYVFSGLCREKALILKVIDAMSLALEDVNAMDEKIAKTKSLMSS